MKNYEKSYLVKFMELVQNGDDELLLGYIEKEASIKPTVITLNNLGWFYMQIGIKDSDSGLWFNDPKKAIEPLVKATKISEKSHYPFTNLGEAYIKTHNYVLAKEILYKSISIQKSIVNQSNLAYVNFILKQYEESVHILKELVNYIKTNNVFDVLKKIAADVEQLNIFVFLYNYACVTAKVGDFFETKRIADELLLCWETGIINIEDVDIIDIISLYYLCNDYKKVITLYPEDGFVINKQIFGVYCVSLMKLGKENAAEKYVEKIICEINEEMESYKNNVSGSNLNCILKECTKMKQEILDLYNNALDKIPVEIDILPKIIESNYIFKAKNVL